VLGAASVIVTAICFIMVYLYYPQRIS